jgi:short-subunit dehydrogenase
LRTNFVAPALLLSIAGGRLAERGGGTLVAISSVAGDRGRQSNYFYGAAKGGLTTFLGGLRNRLFRRGVHVVTVKPGFVDTPMTAGMKKNALFVPPSAVAESIVRAVELRRDVVYVPWFWRAIMLLVRLVPERMFKRMST